MDVCSKCKVEMNDNFILQANTYGKISIISGKSKPNEIKVAVCPRCGQISLHTLAIQNKETSQ